MFNSIKDRSVYYPFLPSDVAGVLPLVQHIRDLRIAWNVSSFQEFGAITATAISASQITFTAGTASTINVPIYHGVDVYPSTESYMLVDTGYTTYLQANEQSVTYILNALRPHPDCFFFYQEAPVLSLQTRDQLTTSGTAAPQQEVVLNGSVLNFSDGYNVSVGWTGGILLTGLEGGGLGAVPVSPSPFADGSGALTYVYEKGLRSINGKDGSVTLTGYSETSLDAESGVQIILSFKDPQAGAQNDTITT